MEGWSARLYTTKAPRRPYRQVDPQRVMPLDVSYTTTRHLDQRRRGHLKWSLSG